MGRLAETQSTITTTNSENVPGEAHEMGKYVKGRPNPMPIVVRTVPDEGKKSVSINVPQGIGDIFWVYQKFAPYFDLIHFKILVTRHDVVQERAARWLDILPKTGNISIECVSHDRYTAVISSRYQMSTIMKDYNNGCRDFDYSCNLALEEGDQLHSLDNDYPAEEVVGITTTQCPLVFDDFIACYVSGGTKELGAVQAGCWNLSRWSEFFMRFEKEFSTRLPFMFVGASYDREVTSTLSEQLTKHGFATTYYIDSFPANVAYILKKAKFFIGYQSGLNVLCDNLGTAQFMNYFPKLKPMMYSWCRPEHVKKKFFAELFSSSPYEAIKNLKDAHFSIK